MEQKVAILTSEVESERKQKGEAMERVQHLEKLVLKLTEETKETDQDQEISPESKERVTESLKSIPPFSDPPSEEDSTKHENEEISSFDVHPSQTHASNQPKHDEVVTQQPKLEGIATQQLRLDDLATNQPKHDEAVAQQPKLDDVATTTQSKLDEIASNEATVQNVSPTERGWKWNVSGIWGYVTGEM